MHNVDLQQLSKTLDVLFENSFKNKPSINEEGLKAIILYAAEYREFDEISKLLLIGPIHYDMERVAQDALELFHKNFYSQRKYDAAMTKITKLTIRPLSDGIDVRAKVYFEDTPDPQDVNIYLDYRELTEYIL